MKNVFLSIAMLTAYSLSASEYYMRSDARLTGESYPQFRASDTQSDTRSTIETSPIASPTKKPSLFCQLTTFAKNHPYLTIAGIGALGASAYKWGSVPNISATATSFGNFTASKASFLCNRSTVAIVGGSIGIAALINYRGKKNSDIA